MLAEPKSADKVPTLPQVGTDKMPAQHEQQDLVEHVDETGQLLTELDAEDDNRSYSPMTPSREQRRKKKRADEGGKRKKSC